MVRFDLFFFIGNKIQRPLIARRRYGREKIATQEEG